MKSSLLKISFSVMVGISISISLIVALQQTQMIGYAVGETLCVVPQGESTGPFTPCDQVFTSIQDAVDTAVSGQEIWVATGVYTDVHTRNNITQVVYLNKSITLQGGYAIPFDTQPNPETNPTTLDAEGNGRVIYVAQDQTVSIIGLNLINGDATDLGGNANSPNGWGGGVFAIGATLTLSQVTIANNIADTQNSSGVAGAFGGGVAIRNGVLYLHNSVISHNVAAIRDHGVGGGLALENSDFYIENNVIVSNTAVLTNTSRGIGFGGGIAIADSTGIIINNQIGWNVSTDVGAAGNGGGIYFENETDQTLTIQGNDIFNNIATANEDLQISNATGSGGGICIYNHSNLQTIIHANNFRNNSATTAGQYGLGGGILIINRNNKLATLSFKNNILLENYANKYVNTSGHGDGGGAVFAYIASTLEHNQFISNTGTISAPGGISALFIASGTLQSKNDLFIGNRSHDTLFLNEGAVASMTNTVIIDNEVSSNSSALVVSGANLNLVHPTIARHSGEYAILVNDDFLDNNGTLSVTNGLLVSHSIGIRVEDNNSLFVNGMMWHEVNTAVSQSPLANVTIHNQTVGNPLFAPDGYHLTEASAARFAGVLGTLTYDVDGQGRPSMNPSFGADEYWLTQQYLPTVFRSP